MDITHHTSHITHHTPHITHHTSHITHHTSHTTHHKVERHTPHHNITCVAVAVSAIIGTRRPPSAINTPLITRPSAAYAFLESVASQTWGGGEASQTWEGGEASQTWGGWEARPRGTNLKSCPHLLTQCASSTANSAIPNSWARISVKGRA
jgi:hypothetical protein